MQELRYIRGFSMRSNCNCYVKWHCEAVSFYRHEVANASRNKLAKFRKQDFANSSFLLMEIYSTIYYFGKTVIEIALISNQFPWWKKSMGKDDTKKTKQQVEWFSLLSLKESPELTQVTWVFLRAYETKQLLSSSVLKAQGIRIILNIRFLKHYKTFE